MSRLLIDIGTTTFLYVFGIVWTVRRYTHHDRLAFSLVAVLSPLLMVISAIRVIYLFFTGRALMDPCPPGLTAAEEAVSLEYQKLFGGELRKPSIAARWQLAYEMELQREAERIERAAHKFMLHA